jgi:hypothetical protein
MDVRKCPELFLLGYSDVKSYFRLLIYLHYNWDRGIEENTSRGRKWVRTFAYYWILTSGFWGAPSYVICNGNVHKTCCVHTETLYSFSIVTVCTVLIALEKN